MVKEYKNHKFISMEKMAKLLNCDEVCLWFNETEKGSINKEHVYMGSDHFIKTGYAQYAVDRIDNWYFDFQCFTTKKDFENNSYKEQVFKEINKPLRTIMHHLGLSTNIVTKVKPIYKFIYRNTGEVVDCEPQNISGTMDAQMIGILVKY